MRKVKFLEIKSAIFMRVYCSLLQRNSRNVKINLINEGNIHALWQFFILPAWINELFDKE